MRGIINIRPAFGKPKTQQKQPRKLREGHIQKFLFAHLDVDK